MPFQWLIDILAWIWNNIEWVIGFSVFIFFFSLITPVKRTVRNVQQSAREVFTWDGFVIFLIMMALAFLVTGLFRNLW